jgi:tRNA (guanine-N7-)-methyltransferase
VAVRRRQHVNPLGLGLTRRRAHAVPLPPERALEIEIGCADAQFLFERARDDLRPFYVGVDIRHQLIDDVNRRAERDGLPVVAVFGHANLHLDALFPAGRALRVYVNFPDPWFKRRHRKRRLMDADLARSIYRLLAPGGELLFQSDVWDIALDAMSVLDAMDDLYRNRAGPWSFWKGRHPFTARSWREQHCEQSGLPIWRLLYTRVEAAS